MRKSEGGHGLETLGDWDSSGVQRRALALRTGPSGAQMVCQSSFFPG